MQRTSNFLTFWTILAGCFLLVVFSFGLSTEWVIPGHAKWVATIMLYYLYFICARTILLLAMSFFEYLNSKTKVATKAAPLVTIIIPCYNEEAVIQNSIQSVSKMNYPNLEILVVDDGSTDKTFEKALEMSETFKVRVLTKMNGGKSSALNYGIQQALGDYVLCLDADSELDPQVLKRGVPYFENKTELAAVAGSARVGNAKNLLCMFQKLEYIIGLNFHKKAQSSLSMVTIVPGPIGLFRKKALLEVGCYEKDTFAEDCDLTLKLLMKGYEIKYCPDMIAYTEAPQTFYELTIQRYRWSRGMIQAITKNIVNLKSRGGVNKRNLLILTYMVVETMLIPSINFLFGMTTLIMAMKYEGTNLFGPFFAGLVAMDAAIALYSILTERQVGSLFFLSIVSRITYGFSLEVMRFYAMIDEILRIPMKWGTISRKGMK
ncbi:MAG: glycosyltransferase family 2 protein [Bacteriovoracaceae bacterium]|nr:glycosyltransferase family 2 protein [Bacteriovoracaceae bacterium]